MREEISCLRDRHGAGVSLLRPVQTLIKPSQLPPLTPLPLPLLSLSCLKQRIVGDCLVECVGFVLAGTAGALGIVVPPSRPSLTLGTAT